MKMGRIFFRSLAFYLYNSFITHVPLYCIRHLYLRKILRIKIGKGSAVHMGCFFAGRIVTIGNNTVINRGCYIDGRGGVAIGSNVSISPECYLLSLTHDPHSPDFAAIAKRTSIGDYVWLGARAMILPGTVLGKGCIVGAGAVVTRNIEERAIVAGVPARKIGERKGPLNYILSYRPFFNSDILP
jgi:maltose O-acetyltransferase